MPGMFGQPQATQTPQGMPPALMQALQMRALQQQVQGGAPGAGAPGAMPPGMPMGGPPQAAGGAMPPQGMMPPGMQGGPPQQGAMPPGAMPPGIGGAGGAPTGTPGLDILKLLMAMKGGRQAQQGPMSGGVGSIPSPSLHMPYSMSADGSGSSIYDLIAKIIGQTTTGSTPSQ